MNYFPDLTSKYETSMRESIQQSSNNAKHIVNAAKIQELTTAEPMGKFLCEEIIKYQNDLSKTEDVALLLTQFNQNIIILVNEIGYIGYNMIWFRGKDNDGKPLELIQHINQLNFLLTPVTKSEPESPKRKIGFVAD